MRKKNRTLVAKLLAMVLVLATALCACEEDVIIDGNGDSTEQGGSSTTPNVLTVTVNDVSFKMIEVKGGTFDMGATAEQGDDAMENENPVHCVTLSDYYMGEMEVTQELWQTVMGENPSHGYGVGSNYPVYYVSWDDCQVFISKLNQLTGRNFKLPTEAQWEYAARGGDASNDYKYAGGNSVGNVAWYKDNSGDQSQLIAQKQANELGLYDMSGNVYEWCGDWFGDYTVSTQTNPRGPAEGTYRVMRGGSWFGFDRNLRVSYRSYNTPDIRDSYIGLRLAMDK